MTKLVKVGLISAAAVITAYSSLVYSFQHRLLYIRRSYTDSETASFYEEIRKEGKLSLVNISYKDHETATLHYAKYVKPLIEDNIQLWVCFGGNAMLALDFVDFCWTVQRQKNCENLAFLLIDYPGYGDNKGVPSPSSILASSTRAFKAVAEKYHFASVSTLGVSLGCGAALNFCNAIHSFKDMPKLRNIVLCCPFTSIMDIAKYHGVIPSFLPGALGNILIKPSCNWNNLEAQENLFRTYGDEKLNLTFIHGENDEICPVEMSKTMYNGAQALKLPTQILRLIRLSNCDHNSILVRGFNEMLDAMSVGSRL